MRFVVSAVSGRRITTKSALGAGERELADL